MEIRIGILNAPRELSFESDEPAADISGKIGAAISEGQPLVELKDRNGAVYVVPVAHIGYVQIGAEEVRRVGFVA
ncbi:DUF3107 domain-containing protein [Gryllotalpicola ginsengisoli]|uniref:DUF3107 domain-containing protein n=1 Tax=Gryllotalpicola ginsengisoli TaxID=444608 RepID=UPI00042A866F|nr:DUF3107 domain-containing protein [Gryllotalpicola ginsengisoli]